jgi:hypothetical protein
MRRLEVESYTANKCLESRDGVPDFEQSLQAG